MLTNVVSETNFTMDNNRAAEQLAISNRQWAKQLANKYEKQKNFCTESYRDRCDGDWAIGFEIVALVMQTYTGKSQHANQQLNDFGMVNQPLTMQNPLQSRVSALF